MKLLNLKSKRKNWGTTFSETYWTETRTLQLLVTSVITDSSCFNYKMLLVVDYHGQRRSGLSYKQ